MDDRGSIPSSGNEGYFSVDTPADSEVNTHLHLVPGFEICWVSLPLSIESSQRDV
jgi:hypothetical protein